MTPEKKRILEYSKEKFFREGFYKTSMDSIAEELQISKKTIYKYFPSKDALVKEVVDLIMLESSTKIFETVNTDEDAFTKIVSMFEVASGIFIKFSDKWLNDIKLHSDHWERIDEFRTKKMYSVLTKIIDQGKEEKLFLDLSTEIIITMLVACIRAIVNPEFIYISKYSFSQALAIVFQIVFEGISTEKGKKLFHKSLDRFKK
ncbi:MAG: TetR/AcrR family transcriptional regulator [Bacteroidota bacterium]|nr:TetR/AcrR family transcriptional regulator [Bacteroidota bacterium]